MSGLALPAGRRRGSAGGSGPTSAVAFSAGRALALLAAAVVLGVLLLNVVDGSGRGPIHTGGAAAAATTSTTAAHRRETTTTTSAGAVRPPSQVPAVVLNGSTTNGAASRVSAQLAAAGYPMLAPGNAAKRTGTSIYFAPGYEREAAAVAAVVGGNPQVAPLPSPRPSGSGTAPVVVVLGS